MGDSTDPAATVDGRSGNNLEQLGAVGIADLLLLALVQRRAAAILVEPSTAGVHSISCEVGARVRTLVAIGSPMADAVVARLALLADLDIVQREAQIGRLRVRLVLPSSPTAETLRPSEILLAVRGTSRGLVAEMRRIVGPEDSAGVTLGPLDGAESAPDEEDGQSRYRILSEIGRGGMGIVYRAEHVVLQKEVAIKVLFPGLGEDPALRARLVLEARAACRARHRAIVDVTDFGTLRDGRAFIVMELVEGRTLETMLSEQGKLAPQRALRFAHQIACALGAAARHGVVHRDLKPANIFVDEDDELKVGDFGVACIREPGSERVISADSEDDGTSRVIVGTAAYMSPEQARGEAVDVRSDLYSLGCILFEMLTGRLPYEAEHIMGVINAHVFDPVPSIDDAGDPAVSPLARIAERMLAKKPSERFQSAQEVCDALSMVETITHRPDWRRWLPR